MRWFDLHLKSKDNLKRIVVNLSKPEFDWTADKIVVKTASNKNLLQLARNDAESHQVYVNLLDHDFVLYMHKNEQSFFIKRELVSTIWQRKDLIQKGMTFYKVEDPIKTNKLAPNRMVVIFSSMPPAKDYYSDNVASRMFVRNYPSMQKHLLKNTYILRIMDLNRSSGSYYLNAGHCQTLENDVQSIIADVCHEYTIPNENVVLYGASKGGTGALYHSILGDYHAVVVDPIFSITNYNQDNDIHYLKNVLPEKLLPKFEDALEEFKPNRKKVILGTSKVLVNYSWYSKIQNKAVEVVNLQDEAMVDHVRVSPNCTPEQITYINAFLMGLPVSQ